MEAAISGTNRAVCISLVAAEPLVQGFPPRSSLTELAQMTAVRPEDVTSLRPIKPPSRWTGELAQAIDGTARPTASDGWPGPGTDGARAVAEAISQHLGSVHMAADVVIDEGDGYSAAWRKTCLLVTRSHIALLVMTIDD
ncbi:hypothetical protein [Streptomyces syringium]|uniref:hypothetical protein n=1 Tax=Streptomyces syringium TaxID=76729 RepID=UPI003455A20A